MSGSTTLRSAWLAGVAAVGLVLMGLYPHGFTAVRAPVAVAHPASPTSPGSGTISSTGPTFFEFEAANRAGAATGPGDCIAGNVSGTTASNCSNFLLTVTSPGTQVVRVRLDWGSVSNDYDLYIFDQATTNQVASSGNGTTTFEDATFTPVAGHTYEVLIVAFAAAPGDNIKGRASLTNPPAVTNAARIGPTGTGIVFSRNGNIQTSAGEAPTGKGTLFAKETVRDGEPSIRADVLGNVYPAGIRGVPAGVDVWRFGPNASCPQFTFHDKAEFAAGQDPGDGYVWLGQPDGIIPGGKGAPDAGGGDIEIAVSFPRSFTPTLTHPPTLSMVSLTLANITAAASTNRGNDWTPVNPVAAVAPVDDRQWIESYGDKTVYLYYRTLLSLTGLVLNKSIDGGVTYDAATTLVNPLGFTPGWIDVDQTPNGDGSVNIYLSAQNSSNSVVFHCVDANPALPGGVTCGGAKTVDNTMSHGHLFDVVNVDKAGNVYVAWSNNKDIFYAYSINKGATWSSPVKVTNAGGGGAFPNFNFFPWITAGDDGRLGIVWYGTDKTTNGDNNAEWKAYYAFTDNARAAIPTIRWLPASDHVIHKSNVSQAGFGTDQAVNRNLIDFFQVAHDPRDGAAVIAFADDHNDFDGATYYTRQIAGPGLRVDRNPATPSCPPLTPFRNPEVRDFAGDVTTVSGTGVPDPLVDILSIDYGSKQVGTNLYLMADMAVAQMTPAPPPGVSYRMYFAVNTVRGLMDAGNEYFLEVTTKSPTPEFWLGVTDRRGDGSTNEMRVERIEADQIPGQAFGVGAPGHVRLRVNVNRLHYSFNGDLSTVNTSGSTAPGVGALVIGLRGRVRLDAGVATSLLDQTRGGSFIILGSRDVTQPPTPEECQDDDVNGDSPNRGVRDFDHDGLDDACADKDDDNDGIDDNHDDDHDNDGIKNAADTDDDNDGISDFAELGVVNALYLLLIRK